MRDEFYQRIISSLQGPLNADLFEACACDLLRSVYPTLVPIKGGGDAGMDGAIADGLGEPFPLVCTTGTDVLQNLTTSLNSYMAHDRQRRKVVLATSQHLTPARRRHLEDRARGLGFTLINIYDQAAIADLLYRSPKWCRDLLDITGNPPALSIIPLTHRPLLDSILVGRDTDLEWLRAGNNDRLLVGQPGSGKTFLLYKLALLGDGLFVVDKDRGSIASEIRAQQPKTLIVDDAHARQDLLTMLRQIRSELGAGFTILASCWPGERAAVAQTLNLSSSDVRELDLLDRSQIVEVIKETGIAGPDNLVREIVNQAGGRPGLAVTLSELCLRGDVRNVALGDALSNSLLPFFESVIGPKSKYVLAAFSVGGQFGMSIAAAADATGINLVDVRDIISKLEAGGVIFEASPQCISVRPPALRHALVKDVFFAGAKSLPVADLIANAPSKAEVVIELIAARARGGIVPDALLMPMLESLRYSGVWKDYAGLGKREAQWILEQHPEFAAVVAHPALHYIPEAEIPLLLAAAVGDKQSLHGTPEHPLRLIQDWVQDTKPGTGEAIKRRKTLWKALQTWFLRGGDNGVGFAALQSVLKPGFEYHTVDSALGDTITFHFGSLTKSELVEIQTWWPAIIGVIETLDTIEWNGLCATVEDWTYPGRINAQLSDEIRAIMRSFVGQMLQDIIRIAAGRPGILHWTNTIAQHLALDIQVPIDPAFEILYPQREPENGESVLQQQESDARALAYSWTHGIPNDIVSVIAAIESEARLANISWPRWTPLLCSEIAKTVSRPSAWAKALMENSVSPDLVEPFLLASATANEPEWSQIANACLLDLRFQPAAIKVLLTMPNPPTDLLNTALRSLQSPQGYAQMVRHLCMRAEVPPTTLQMLWQHEDPIIAGMAALGAWYARDTLPIDNSMRNDWCKAIIHAPVDDLLLAPVLTEEPQVAYDWLRARLAKGSEFSHGHGSDLQSAVDALDTEQKSRLLAELPSAAFGFEKVVLQLIGDNLELYHQLLQDQHLKHFHLTPLAGNPEGPWLQKARLALDAGYSPDDIAYATVWASSEGVAFEGSETAVWSEWVERFDRLCQDDDDGIRAIGEAGKAQTSARRDRALQQERQEAIYGID